MSGEPRTKQEEAWRGTFGDQYIQRNQGTSQRIHDRVRAYSEMLRPLAGDPPRTILECGCNVGMNLQALQRVTDATLYAVEPNPKARRIAVAEGAIAEERLFDASLAALPMSDGSIDLVFTSGVLIHVPPVALERAYREIHRVSGRYILTLEYFAKNPEMIRYRGHEDLLYKRDFGGMWLDLFPDLVPVAHGFFWQRVTGLDDPTWWLFRKP